MNWRRAWLWKRQHESRTTYCLQWLDDSGRRRTEAVGPDKRLAEALRKRREMELNSGTYQDIVTIRLAAFAQEHVRLIEGSVSEMTVEEHGRTLGVLLDYSGDVLLEKVTPKMAEEFLAARLKNVAPATANKNLRTLKGIFGAAARRGYVRANPFQHVSPARELEKEVRVLSEAEIESLVSACPDLRWRCFVCLALTTGLRRGELVNLEWDDVDLDEGMIRVRCKAGYRTKSGKNRGVPLISEVAPALRALREESGEGYVFGVGRGRRWRNTLSRPFAEIVRRAGIEPCTIHDLRKTFISHLANAGENQAVVQKLAGHASMATTLKHYTRILPETLRKAPAKLPYAQGLAIVTQLQRGPEPGAETETARVLTGAHAVG
jgi:integrase